jgi:hypothetical protein
VAGVATMTPMASVDLQLEEVSMALMASRCLGLTVRV